MTWPVTLLNTIVQLKIKKLWNINLIQAVAMATPVAVAV
jgi:hypothetical protein